MKLYFLIPIIFLLACQKQKPTPLIDAHLTESLSIAEELRFSHPAVVDSILTAVHDDVVETNDEHLWAQYYFVKAHIAMEIGEYENSTFLLDSATISCSIFEAEYYPKIILLRARINLCLLMIDEAKSYYEELLTPALKKRLNNSELLRVNVGCANICFRLRKDSSPFLADAKNYVFQGSASDQALLYACLAYNNRNSEEAILIYKKAFEFYDSCGDYGNAYTLLKNISNRCLTVDMDSAKYYNDIAKVYFHRNVEGTFFHYDNINLLTYKLISAKYLFANKDYDQAINVIDNAIPTARKLKQELVLTKYYHLLSQCYFELEDYDKSLQCKNKELHYRLEYSAHINSAQIHYNDAREQVEQIKKENVTLRLQEKNRRLQNRLFLAYSIFISILVYLLFRNWKKIKRSFYIASSKVHHKDALISELKTQQTKAQNKTKEILLKKDILILTRQEQLEKINHLVKDSPYKDKSKLNKIENLVSEDVTIQSWEVFYQLYQHKFPNGEQQLRELFPILKRNDYHFLMCAHYGLTHDKMAQIFNIQKASVRKRSLRIKKTLDIPLQGDVKVFISNLLEHAIEK